MDVSGNIVCAYGNYNNSFIFGARNLEDRTYQVNRHGNNLWSKDDYPSMCDSKNPKRCSFKVKYN